MSLQDPKAVEGKGQRHLRVRHRTLGLPFSANKKMDTTDTADFLGLIRYLLTANYEPGALHPEANFGSEVEGIIHDTMGKNSVRQGWLRFPRASTSRHLVEWPGQRSPLL